ncbi:MAG TPA: cobalamin-dependent protein [Myxococcales bacterium]|nr:cobalamin-dependent protein [Myxococcales bacterium]
MTQGRVRVVLGMLGMDQHEVGARVVAGLLRDGGMEVVYLGKFNTPQRFATVADEEDADVIGISVHSWEYLELVPELMKLLAERQSRVPVVVGGSVITPEDEQTLKGLGVAAVFAAGATPEAIVEKVRALGASS